MPVGEAATQNCVADTDIQGRSTKRGFQNPRRGFDIQFSIWFPQRMAVPSHASRSLLTVAKRRLCLRLLSSSGEDVARPSSRLRFDDHRTVFSHKTSWELLRGLLVLRICGFNVIADNALKLFRFGHNYLGERVLGWILRPTVYAQFVAAASTRRQEDRGSNEHHLTAEAEDGLRAASESLHGLGLRLMVAPTLEGDVGEGLVNDLYERNLQELLQLANLAWELGGGSNQRHPCLQVKATALLSADILRIIAKQFEEATFSNKIKMVELVAEKAIAPGSNHHAWQPFPGVSKEITEAFYKGARRFGKLGLVAKNIGLHLMVDAEYTYVNPAVSLLALAAMTVINQNKAIVCHTLQCYLKGAINNLKREIQISNHLGICYGAKIVRGAYLEQERSLATQESDNPTCASHEETGQNYKRVITYFMEHAAKTKPGNCFVVVATHNEEGVCYALDTMQSLGLSAEDGRIAFAQIYGMAEQISMPLVRGGYIVYKSVPVGGLSQVLPYLARRAAENRAVLLGARKERELLQKELIWRLRSQFS